MNDNITILYEESISEFNNLAIILGVITGILLVVSIFMFLFAKSINIGSNKFINLLSASTFGVLMIHANSNTMRKWLWQDVCKNVENFTSSSLLQFIFHAVVCTLVVYIVCVFIDIIRKKIVNILLKKGK